MKFKILLGVVILFSITVYIYHPQSLDELIQDMEAKHDSYIEAKEKVLVRKLSEAERCVDRTENEAEFEECKYGFNGVKQVSERLHELKPDKYDAWTARYDKPWDLFYTFLEEEGVYVSQNYDTHKQKGSGAMVAIDVATGGRSLKQYAPDIYNKEVVWTVKADYYNGSTGKTIDLYNDEWKVSIGHVRDVFVVEGQKVKTGEIIATTGGTESDEGVSTGYHAHYEYYQWSNDKAELNDGDGWNVVEYVYGESNKRNKWREKQEKEEQIISDGYIKFTTYNAEVGQTDADPCNGATANVCELYDQGKNPIALSRDLIQARNDFDANNGYCTANCPFEYGETVLVAPKDHWQGDFTAVIVDTMNIRYKNRGDLFKDDRSKNTSFYATIKKL